MKYPNRWRYYIETHMGSSFFLQKLILLSKNAKFKSFLGSSAFGALACYMQNNIPWPFPVSITVEGVVHTGKAIEKEYSLSLEGLFAIEGYFAIKSVSVTM